MNKQLVALLLLSLSNLHASAPAAQTSALRETIEVISGYISLIHTQIPHYLGVPYENFEEKISSIVDEQGNPISFAPETPMFCVRVWSNKHEGYPRRREETSGIQFAPISFPSVVHPDMPWNRYHPLLGASHFPDHLPLSLLEGPNKTIFNIVSAEQLGSKKYKVHLTHHEFDNRNFEQSLLRAKQIFAGSKRISVTDESLELFLAKQILIKNPHFNPNVPFYEQNEPEYMHGPNGFKLSAPTASTAPAAAAASSSTTQQDETD